MKSLPKKFWKSLRKRIRAIRQSPDGDLYFLTDSPKAKSCGWCRGSNRNYVCANRQPTPASAQLTLATSSLITLFRLKTPVLSRFLVRGPPQHGP